MLYRFGDYQLDTARCELSRRRHSVRAKPQVLKLLLRLIENRDRVVGRDELHRMLWGKRIVSDNALSVAIRSARAAVGDTGDAQSVIRTVPGYGYRFVADVAISAHGHIESEQDSAHIGPTSEKASDLAVPPPEHHTRAQPSIVVLPFDNIGGEESSRTIGRGLVHDIITRIARSRTMFIIARGTTFHFEGKEQDVGKIGRKLGVRYVVQGAVQVSGQRLRVSVALANVASGGEIWSHEYNRSLDDFMTVQQEIAETVVGSLETEVQRDEVQRSLLMPSSNLDAWSAYHRGLHYLFHFKRTDCEKAEHFLRRSIDLEPNIPRPYAALSFVHFERVFLNFDRDRGGALRKAFDYAVQSLEIDPLDPMGHWALSRAYLLQNELENSKLSLERAIELNPSYAVAQYSLGWVALHLGEHELCLEKIGFARRLSPYDPLKFAMLGVYALNLALMGRTEEAAALSLRSTLQPNAHHLALVFAAVTHALDGQLERARAFFSRVRAIAPGYDLEQFLSIFAFRCERDLRRISDAFDLLKGRTPPT